MIRAGELVDHTIKNGKIEANKDIGFKKRNFVKKNEEETQAIFRGG